MLGLVCVCAVIFVIGYITSLQMNLAKKKDQLKDIKQQTQDQESDNKKKQDLLNSGDEKSIIERIAREELGYVAPSERIFFDVSGN